MTFWLWKRVSLRGASGRRPPFAKNHVLGLDKKTQKDGAPAKIEQLKGAFSTQKALNLLPWFVFPRTA
jgi:hypothetical protein